MEKSEVTWVLHRNSWNLNGFGAFDRGQWLHLLFVSVDDTHDIWKVLLLSLVRVDGQTKSNLTTAGEKRCPHT